MSAESDARVRASLLNNLEAKTRALTGTPEDALAAAEDRLAFIIAELKERAEYNGNSIQVAKDLAEIPVREAELAASKSGEAPLLDTAKVKNFHTLARDLGEPNDFGQRLAEILDKVDEVCAALPDKDRLFVKQDIAFLFLPKGYTTCQTPDSDRVASVFGKPREPGSLSEHFAATDAARMPDSAKDLQQMVESLAADVGDTLERLDEMRYQERQAAREAQRTAQRTMAPGS